MSDTVKTKTSEKTKYARAVIISVILLFVSFTGCISFDFDTDPKDSDGDGVPDEEDIFPDDTNESEDSDGDGIGNNEDSDDDNDGIEDEDDAFPDDKNETSDNDFDGVGDNEDPDDDNDGFNDTEDIDPLHDLALSVNFSWVNLTVQLNKRSFAWFQFELLRDGVRLKMFDNDGNPWKIPWQTQYNITASFEINVPDNITDHLFQIRAFEVKWFSSRLLDIGESNESYLGNLSYNLSTGTVSSPVDGILNGSIDNGTDEPDTILAVTMETIHFGYRKTYTWNFEGKEYTMSYNFDPGDYSFYSSQAHQVRDYDDYVNFATPDDPTLMEFSLILHSKISDRNLTSLQEAQYILNFVQALKYAEDNVTTGIGEYPRYPLETLVDQMGDCEDTAILALSLAEIRGIESALILLYEAFPDAGHAAAAFSVNGSGSYYEFGDMQYFYGETTGSGWQIGEMPEFNSTEAYIYEIT